MSAISQQLDSYLGLFRQRLKKVRILQGAAILATVILLVSLAGAYLAIRSGFATDVVIIGRLLLVLSAVIIAFLFIIQPLQRLKQNIAADVERRTPAFSGRIETYLGMRDSKNPFRELLAEDALTYARQYPPERQIHNKELLLPSVIAAICVTLLLWVAVSGPGLLNYGVRNLWAGWAFPGLTPPQSISVIPGNEAVRRGGSVRLLARMQGFDPSAANIHVQLGDRDWQEVEMIRTEEGFEFTFFSMREPVSYYVASTGIRSPAYQIQVVDLPDIENLKLTYHYPEWTSREPDVFEYGGDIRAISGTNIDLEVITNTPLPAGVLVLNGEPVEMEVYDRTGRGRFEITQDGQYYVAARVGRELVRLTDDYFIRVIEDGRPEIRFTRPGRDWNANPIEEVTVRIEAEDDYQIETMELRYSVNGGGWQSVPLNANERHVTAEHVFMLESIRAGGNTAVDGAGETNLVAGDLVAYYAQATDRHQTASTDIYFIQVQPFDRRYAQSQQGGGGGGSQGTEQEISQRQKEIIVSTWNLIREKTQARGEMSDATRDNAILLSSLQTTLAEQAQTLADRTRARQLHADQEIARFIENLDKAAEAMKPASEYLAALDLEAAIQPEQEALQYLLRAEAVFTDMQVSMQQDQRGGGGGSRAGHDLAEMFELEMDLKKNQYETGSSASPRAQSQQADDTMRQLEELARRQEQLANNMRNQQNLTEAQRWQQEMLRREAEQLQERMDRMQQQASASGSQQGRQSSSGNQTGEQGSDEYGNESDAGAGRSELSRRMESAIRAMDEIADAMRNGGDRDALERATDEARRQLEGARSQVADDQQRSMQERFERMAGTAGELYQDQIRMEQQLQEAVQRALADRAQQRQSSGLSRQQEAELADEKRAMNEQVQQLQREIHAAAEQYRDQSPQAVQELEMARELLRRSQMEERLYIAAEYIAHGAAPFVAGSESAVTQALSELRERLQRAQIAAAGTNLSDENNLDRALAQTRALRQELQQLPRSAEQMQAAGSQTGEQSEGQAGEQVGQQDSIGAGGDGYGGGWEGYANRGRYSINPEDWSRFGRNLNDTAQAIRQLLPELRNQDISIEELNSINDLTRQLEQRHTFATNRNEEILQQEYLAALSLLEQLELRLDAGARSKQPANVRTTSAEQISTEYKDAVAEYYRRLSREE